MEITQHRDGGPERRAVTAMIVSKPVLAAIAARWDRELFSSRWASLVGGWCVGYFQKYGKAPGPNIERLFDAWAESGGKDPATVKLVEKFLLTLSGAYERERKKVNPAHAIDEAAAHFRDVGLDKLKDRIQAALEDGDGAKAQELVEAYRRVEMGQAAGCNPLRDQVVVTAAFDTTATEDLIPYPGAAGKFFTHALQRGCFLAFTGIAKVGKSFFLMDAVFRALRAGRRVAYFEVGDMSQGQVIRRLACRAAARPIYGDPDNPVQIPRGIETGKPPTVEYTPKTFPDDLNERVAWKALSKIGAESGDNFRLSVHSNDTVAVPGLVGIIEGWARDGFQPEIVIIDYADILAPVDRKLDERGQINGTWKALRGLSQDLNCLLITATQADAAGYKAKTMDRSNFSGDRRKNDHVTGMVGINQTKEEKENGLYRLNWMHQRELEFDPSRELWCACCLPLGRPMALTTF